MHQYYQARKEFTAAPVPPQVPKDHVGQSYVGKSNTANDNP